MADQDLMNKQQEVTNHDNFDSGVSNGDVDWLFRGKSKKLTKKMNQNKEIDEKDHTNKLETRDSINSKDSKDCKENIGQNDKLVVKDGKDKELTDSKTLDKDKIGKTLHETQTTHHPVNQKLAKDGAIEPSLNEDPKSDNTLKDEIRPECEKQSKLDKLFRPRSSSSSSSKDKKKFNLINYSGQSFDGITYNMEDNQDIKLNNSISPTTTSGSSNANANHNPSTNSKSNAVPISPRNRSRSSSVGSNSSNSSFTKKSIFSTLSSKFKPSSNEISPTNSSTSTTPLNSNINSTTNSTINVNNATPNILTGNSMEHKNIEDLTSLYNKVPAELNNGIPIRKNSIDNRDSEIKNSPKNSPSGFNSFFKRRSSTSSQSSIPISQSPQLQQIQRRPSQSKQPPASAPASSPVSISSSSFSSSPQNPRQMPSPRNSSKDADKIILNKNPNRHDHPIKELNTVSLKRVNFAIDKLSYDPQQQIPSRRPKKGNVLIPEDLIAPPPRLSQGISLNDGTTKNDSTPKYSEKELSLAIEAQKRALIEAEKHSQEAHLSARRLSLEVNQYKLRMKKIIPTINKDKEKDKELEDINEFENSIAEDIEIDDDSNTSTNTSVGANDIKKIEIDKPLHVHEKHFEEDDLEIDISNLTLEQIYTRCCHLREILPIPATLKQLKNKSKPLSVLKLLNPKPTLIDILSFSDFIAIIPITTIIFDNVTMTTEMLKHILGSLVYNKSLEKLSLRNVPIDELGWKYLCKFLSRNISIKKLDISQQRIKSDLNPKLIRSSMNWELFIKSLILRGGMEELVINGCKLNDEIFERLINNSLINTMRLGIASCELNDFKSNIVCNWLKNPKTKCVGVDIAFNDLSKGQLKFFIDAFNSGNVNLIFFSLYQTNLSNVEEFTELLKALVKVKTIRFLDLSSLPNLFPAIISKLNVYLPKFETLKRIHFDLNDLTSQSIIAISEILPKINGLFHVSFLGNRNLNNSVAASIYAAIKKSNSIHTLDLDYDLINDTLNQRIAFYLMRNLDNVVDAPSSSNKDNNSGNNDDKEQEELMFDGSLLMEAAEKLLIENENKPNKDEDIKLQKIISNALIERTREIRESIHKTIDTLFNKRNNGTLSLEGKESLLRFCLLDSSLEQLVHIFEEQAKKSSSMSASPSVELDNIDNVSPLKDSFDESKGENTHTVSSIDRINNPNDITNHRSISSIPEKSAAHIDDDKINVMTSTTNGSNSMSSFNKLNHPSNINLNDDKLLHHNSTELITSGPILSPRNTETLNKLGYFTQTDQSTFQPHQVVVDSSKDGKNIPIDYLTGRPVLMRSISQTSTHAKEQELEEGEFHRWGFFMEQRNNSSGKLNEEIEDSKKLPKLNVLPSGNELRDAIIEAKGIESITELINKINNNRISLDNIYHISDQQQKEQVLETLEQLRIEEDRKQQEKETMKQDEINLEIKRKNNEQVDDNDSIDSNPESNQVDAVVDEAYDKLLNDAQRVRSNK